MIFRYEKSDDQTWPEMQAEHELLAEALRLNPRRGSISTLNHRVVEPTHKAALYFLAGIGMGRGRSFALVQGGDILWVDVINNEIRPDEYDVTRVTIPEKL